MHLASRRLQPNASSFHCAEKPTQRGPHLGGHFTDRGQATAARRGLAPLATCHDQEPLAGRRVTTAHCRLGGGMAGASDLGRRVPETQCALQTGGWFFTLAAGRARLPGPGGRFSQGGSARATLGSWAPTNGPEDTPRWPCRVARRRGAARAPVGGP